MNGSRWRKEAAPVIRKVLMDTQGKPEAEIRKALHDAYPFGQRAYHPYKIWLDEIQRQRGKRHPIGHKRAWENSQKRQRGELERLQEWEAIYGRRA